MDASTPDSAEEVTVPRGEKRRDDHASTGGSKRARQGEDEHVRSIDRELFRGANADIGPQADSAEATGSVPALPNEEDQVRQEKAVLQYLRRRRPRMRIPQ